MLLLPYFCASFHSLFLEDLSVIIISNPSYPSDFQYPVVRFPFTQLLWKLFSSPNPWAVHSVSPKVCPQSLIMVATYSFLGTTTNPLIFLNCWPLSHSRVVFSQPDNHTVTFTRAEHQPFLSLCRFQRDHDTNRGTMTLIIVIELSLTITVQISVPVLLDFYLKLHPHHLFIFNYLQAPLGSSLTPQTPHSFKIHYFSKPAHLLIFHFQLIGSQSNWSLTRNVKIILDWSLFFSPHVLSVTELHEVLLLNLPQSWPLGPLVPLP